MRWPNTIWRNAFGFLREGQAGWTGPAVLTVAMAVFAAHLAVVLYYAVDLPYADDWQFLAEDQLPAGLSLEWLYRQHQEHRYVTAKFLFWLLYQFGGWNLITQQAVNFFLYGGVVCVVGLFARRAVPELPTAATVGFLIFLLSPLSHNNHIWAVGATFHFFLLFFSRRLFSFPAGAQHHRIACR